MCYTNVVEVAQPVTGAVKVRAARDAEKNPCRPAKSTMPLDNYYTISEAADMIGVHRTTLHRWIRDGKLKPERIWGRSLLALDQLRPLAIKKCATCDHQYDSRCACRETCNIPTEPGQCADWAWKWN